MYFTLTTTLGVIACTLGYDKHLKPYQHYGVLLVIAIIHAALTVLYKAHTADMTLNTFILSATILSLVKISLLYCVSKKFDAVMSGKGF